MRNFIIAFILTFPGSLFASDDKANFDDSLNKTQELLRDANQRHQAISETSDARKADAQVRKLAPDQATQNEYYNLAADIMNNYRAEKDEAAMNKSVQDGLRNPAQFYENLTPEQKQKIQDLSGKLNPGTGPRP